MIIKLLTLYHFLLLNTALKGKITEKAELHIYLFNLKKS